VFVIHDIAAVDFTPRESSLLCFGMDTYYISKYFQITKAFGKNIRISS
jgi:hypothetical protein